MKEREAVKVSVIIPVYNTEKYIEECINSVLNQTMEDFEIICVDDGSKDNTLEILKSISQKDPRVEILNQKHLGAGQARNIGIQRACGEYLYFLDADDWIECNLLEEVVGKMDATQSDICLFGARKYIQSRNEFEPMKYILRRVDKFEEEVFSRAGHEEELFRLTSGVPWNKVFRTQFVQDNKLEYMKLERSNDVYFVYMAMALAKRITYINKEFIFHRTGMTTNLQANNDRAPLCFYEAQKKLKEGLKMCGVWEDLKYTFINRALASTVYNLCNLKTREGFEIAYNKIQREGINILSFSDLSEDKCWLKRDYKFLGDVMHMRIDDFIEKNKQILKV